MSNIKLIYELKNFLIKSNEWDKINPDDKQKFINCLDNLYDELIYNDLKFFLDELYIHDHRYLFEIKTRLLSISCIEHHFNPELIQKVIKKIEKELNYSFDTLNLTHNNFEELPDLTALENIITLDISNNLLKNVPKLPPNLLNLRISSNKLERVPYIENLEYLDVSNNKISEFSKLSSNLKYLDFSFNNMKDFPDIKFCQNLKEIKYIGNIIDDDKIPSKFRIYITYLPKYDK